MKKDTRLLASAAAVTALVAVGIYLITRGAPEPAQPPLVGSSAPVTPQPDPPTNGTKPPETTPSAGTVTVYRVDEGNAQVEPHLVKATVPASPGEDPIAFALNAMAQDKNSPLPTATRVRSVKVTNGIAHVDFNKAFGGAGEGGNFTGGSLDESLALNALLKTLAQFPEVKQVQVTVGGKSIESLGGHFDWSKPMAIDGDAAMTAQGEPQ